MNTKQIALIVIPFALVLAFQNCQKPAGVVVGAASVDDPNAVPYEVISLEKENLQKIEFRTDIVESQTLSQKSVAVQTPYVLKVDLQSGEILAESEVSEKSVRYCLDQASKSKLISILQKDSVCKFHSKPLPAGTMCTMAITPAYASIITNSSQFKLGEAESGCPKIEIELCNNGDALKSFVQDLKEKLPSLSCQ
jgi:tRNA A-37 threonylcarbamoyl transferase component Bud32